MAQKNNITDEDKQMDIMIESHPFRYEFPNK